MIEEHNLSGHLLMFLSFSPSFCLEANDAVHYVENILKYMCFTNLFCL